jgi:hypothetical protein
MTSGKVGQRIIRTIFIILIIFGILALWDKIMHWGMFDIWY